MRKMHHFGRSIALLLAWAGLCVRVGLADGKDQKANDAKALRALAAARPAAAKDVTVAVGQLVAVPAAAPDQWNLVIQNDALGQQFRAQFRPILAAELSFIRHVCDVPQEKRPKVKAAGEAGLNVAARQYVLWQQGRARAGAQNAAAGNAPPPPYPPKIIHDALAGALKETLPPKEFARYTDESAKRAESRKQAAVLWAVSRLDGALFLTAAQREEIAASIRAQWQDHWEQWLSLSYGDEYFPQIPRRVVAPHLREEQKLVWRRLQKVDFGINGDAFAAAAENDGYWGDEPQEAAAPAIANPAVIFTGDIIIDGN